jgi:hypothetical protein
MVHDDTDICSECLEHCDVDEDNLEVKIFVVSLLLQELIDQTHGDTRFKHQLKFHLRETQKSLDQILSVRYDSDELSLFISKATEALEKAIEIN